MIYQNSQTENTQDQISYAIRELGLGKMLRKANITKNCGVPAYEVFQFLLLLVFQGKNLFRFLHSKHRDQAVSKNTYYRFLNESSYNWGRFLMLLAVKVTSAFDTLTRPERVKVLILDDTVVKRNRSKSVELLARFMIMWSINSRKGLHCSRLAGLMGTALSPPDSTCFLRLPKATVIMKPLTRLTAEQTGISFVKKA